MGGLLVATVTFTVIVAVLVAVLAMVTVVPVFVTLQMADARRFSTTRWFLFSGLTVLAGLGYAYLLHKHDAPRLVTALPLALSWAGPGALWLLEEGQERFGGRAGRHK
jgi:hypothetical protein